MDSYEINRDTVALIPKDQNTTIVYEVDNSFVINKKNLLRINFLKNCIHKRV